MKSCNDMIHNISKKYVFILVLYTQICPDSVNTVKRLRLRRVKKTHTGVIRINIYTKMYTNQHKDVLVFDGQDGN